MLGKARVPGKRKRVTRARTIEMTSEMNANHITSDGKYKKKADGRTFSK